MFKTGLFLLGAVFLVMALVGSSTACDEDDKARLLKDNACAACNLSGCDLSRANLHEANLREADLSGANLSGANLWKAGLGGATWVDGSTCKEGSIGQCNH